MQQQVFSERHQKTIFELWCRMQGAEEGAVEERQVGRAGGGGENGRATRGGAAEEREVWITN